MAGLEFVKEKAKKAKDYVKENAKDSSKYYLVRFVLLRALGLTYLFAFLSLVFQVIPLLGSDGILPADTYLQALAQNFQSTFSAFTEVPTLFWFHISDTALLTLSIIGLIISLVILVGYANVPLLFTNWLLYLSFVNIGQTWYGYGWEIQLLETGFLAIFLAPFWNARPFPRDPPPVLVIWLFRLLAFKVSLGAGLIKIRGDECWDKLTCLYTHYETQPIPNPLSPYFHHLPDFFHELGVLVTHFVQTIAPWFVLLGKFLRNWGGAIMLGFQVFLMFTGNYAFLNLVTIVAIIAYFDDSFLEKVMPQKLVEKANEAKENAREHGKIRKVITAVLVTSILAMSVPVFANLASSNQVMNTSYGNWNIVGTYGAFGSIGEKRGELVIQGTHDETIGPGTQWREYDFPGKPTPVDEDLPVIAPYQPRLDWQIWFAAMKRPQQTPWLLHYVWKLLHNDPAATKLLEKNTFPNEPPEYIRIQYYRYEFASLESDQVWNREFKGTWLPPISKDNQELKRFVERRWGE